MIPAELAMQAVMFDLGGVVLGSPVAALRALERERGLPPGDLARVIAYAGGGSSFVRLERGELPIDAFLPAFDAELREAGFPLGAADLMGAIETAMAVRPRMLAAARRLRTAGYRVAALTNNWHQPGAMADRFAALEPEFDVFIQSCREGMRKPEPGIYALACERLGLAPERIVFLDDLGQNLKPARAMGMTTIRFEDEDQALADLSRALDSEL